MYSSWGEKKIFITAQTHSQQACMWWPWNGNTTSISLCNIKLWHTWVYNRLRTLRNYTEIKFVSHPTRLNQICQVAHTLPVGHAALWHNTSNVRTKTVTETIILCLLLVSVRRGWVITPLVGNAVLRRKPQSTFCVSVRPSFHSDVHIWVPSFWTLRILGN
jgi:hypothetical protein